MAMATYGGDPAQVLFVLGLLTLADSIINAALGTLMDPSALKPGMWNIGTMSVVFSGVTDVTGQLFLGYLADSKGAGIASLVNISSILLASIVPLISLPFANQWPLLATVLAPLLRAFGGGSHATGFLTLGHLHEQKTSSTRAILYSLTGAVVVISQSVGSFVTPRLTIRSPVLPYAVAILCCGVAFCAVILSNPSSSFFRANDTRGHATESDALLRPRDAHLYSSDQSASTLTLISNYLSECKTHVSRARDQNNIPLIARAFALAAVSKATRPLFTTYIQSRDGITPSRAQQLWLLRAILSVIIFALILPCLIYFLQSQRSITPLHTTFYAARVSIVLMGIGALLIGLAESPPVLLTALIINTLGVATDLNLLAFLANFVPNKAAGQIIMLIASLESAGTLVGVGIIYPIYQWSMNQASLAGGVPYYICATIYAVVASLIWALKPM